MKIAIVLSSILLLSCSGPSKKVTTTGFEPRPIEEYTLSNGLQVMLVKDTTLPYFTLNMLMKSGAAEDGPSPGLSHITASLLERGTKSKSATVLADHLGQMATDFEASVQMDYTLFKLSSLNTFQAELLETMREVLIEPAFLESEVQLLKKQLSSEVAKFVDNPSSFADHLIGEYIFEGHPYGKPITGTLASIKKINRQDITRHYKRVYQPNNMVLAVIGNFTDDVKTQIEKKFGSWPSSQKSILALKDPLAPEKISLRFVDKPDLVQAQIRFGHVGVPRNHPDFLALRIANSILGSGFTSRLVNRVRDQLGLTYHISSRLNSHMTTGSFEIRTFTQNQKVGEAIQETLKTYTEFYERGAAVDEVKDAKSYLIGQFPQVVETAEAWAFNLMVLRLYGVPDTYLTQFEMNVKQVTAEQVNRVIKTYFHPTKIKILVHSTYKDVSEQLKPFGNAEVKNFKDYQ